MPLTRVGKGKELHSIAGAGHKATEVSEWGSPAGPHPPPRTLPALTPRSSLPGRGGGAGRELPSSKMAPREAGPSRPLPGFRCRAFWFRSNSALAAPSCSSPSSSCRRRCRRSRNVRPAAAGVEPVTRAGEQDSLSRPLAEGPRSALACSGGPGVPSKQPPTESLPVGDPPLSTKEEWTPAALLP